MLAVMTLAAGLFAQSLRFSFAEASGYWGAP